MNGLIGGDKFFIILFKVVLMACCWLSLQPSLAFANPAIQFGYVKENIQDQQLRLNAVVEFDLPEPIILALHSEIPLQFKTEILLLEAQEIFGFSFNRVRQSIEYHTELYAHGVNRHYVLHNHRNQKKQTFQTLEAALQTLGTLQALPIISLINLSEQQSEPSYTFKIRLSLDKWKLPAPLLIDAIFEPYWHLDSGWVERKVILDLPLRESK